MPTLAWCGQWRMNRSWAGRVQEAHWKLLMQGTKVSLAQGLINAHTYPVSNLNL